MSFPPTKLAVPPNVPSQKKPKKGKNQNITKKKSGNPFTTKQILEEQQIDMPDRFDNYDNEDLDNYSVSEVFNTVISLTFNLSFILNSNYFSN